MSKVAIMLNSQGIGELLKSDEVANFVESTANDIKTRCGTGSYTVDTQRNNRAISRVKTADNETFYRNLHNNELLNALR